MILVAAADVGVEYDGRRVLGSVDLHVREAAHASVTGRSGSGKTTLLLVLSGLLAPTTGAVSFKVEPRDIAYVPQAASLIPELSARDNTALGLRLRGIDPEESRARAVEALTLLGLADALDAFPAELSGGMQQRVALARALALRPPLLLADEPTGALDRATGRQVLLALREHGDRYGTAILVATHDLEVAAQFPQRIAVADGRVAA